MLGRWQLAPDPGACRTRCRKRLPPPPSAAPERSPIHVMAAASLNTALCPLAEARSLADRSSVASPESLHRPRARRVNRESRSTITLSEALVAAYFGNRTGLT